jgi:hypothetical protein
MLDNYDLFEQNEARKEKWLESRPICSCCEEPIQSEKAYCYKDQWFCKDRDCRKAFMEIVWEDIESDYLENVED